MQVDEQWERAERTLCAKKMKERIYWYMLHREQEAAPTRDPRLVQKTAGGI